MKFLAVASLLFASTLAVPTSQCGECQHHPGGNNPGGNYPGGNNPGGNNPGGNNPGGNNPGGNNPGGNNPGGNNPGGNNPGGNNPGGNNPGGNNPGGNNPGGNNPGGNNPGGNNPGGNNPGSYKPCPSGLYTNLQCCATDVLGVAALDCASPSKAPTSAGDLKSACSGKAPKCCVLPVAGQAVLCTDPVGGSNPGGNNPGGNNPGGNNPGGNNPGGNNPGDYKACPSGLYSNAQCCSTNVLGVAAVDCANPSSKPTSGPNFAQTCSAKGKKPLCCVLPVAGQDLLCTEPTGTNGGNNGGNNPGGNNPGNNPGGNNPGGNNPGGNPAEKPCPGKLYSNPQCCSVNVLGVAALDCAAPSSTSSKSDFKSSCSSKGKKAVCCVLPVAGQDVLCTEA